jgi:hypothetical protein
MYRTACVAVLMALALVACSSGGSQETSSTTTSSGATTTTTPASSGGPSTSAGSQGSTPSTAPGEARQIPMEVLRPDNFAVKSTPQGQMCWTTMDLGSAIFALRFVSSYHPAVTESLAETLAISIEEARSAIEAASSEVTPAVVAGLAPDVQPFAQRFVEDVAAVRIQIASVSATDAHDEMEQLKTILDGSFKYKEYPAQEAYGKAVQADPVSCATTAS